jgi:hypothetical protein
VTHRTRLVIAAFAGAFAAFAVVVAIVPSPAKERPFESSESAFHRLEFRWQRWRTGEFVASERAERLVDGRRGSLDRVTIYQREQDRIVMTATSAEGIIGGQSVSCHRANNVLMDCRWSTLVPAAGDSAVAITRGDQARDEMARLRSQAFGQDALYRIAATNENCFVIRRIRAGLAVDWGDRTELCFDARNVLVTEVRTVAGTVDRISRRFIESPVPSDALPTPSA